jgi:hypothetical protein
VIKRHTWRGALKLASWCLAGAALAAFSGTTLPNRADSVKFAVIGDAGTGERPQLEIAARMLERRDEVAYDLVLMVGDNFYGAQRPADLEKKFGLPYAALLNAGVSFRAALGNHDQAATVNYHPIAMDGRRYYTYVKGNVRFLVLDTNVIDAPQLAWAETVLRDAREPWKIAYFHHPLYSNAGRHGSAVDVRVLIEPLLLAHGVRVVFSGHDHIYERLKPQKGIDYFVVGSSGQLRRGDLRKSATTAAGFDQDQAFLLVEISGDELFFEAISRTGVVVDSGQIRRVATSPGS